MNTKYFLLGFTILCSLNGYGGHIDGFTRGKIVVCSAKLAFCVTTEFEPTRQQWLNLSIPTSQQTLI